jgi:ketosteroid isomerase-like protein
MSAPAPSVVTRYFAAADARDFTGLANCFTSDGFVVDEGTAYRGRDEIIGWRQDLAGKWTFTTTVTGSDPVSSTEFRVHARVEGNFPGGVADLTYRFVLQDDAIAELSIA